MRKVKVAILEDSPMLLKQLREDLLETGLVEVVAYAGNSEEFKRKLADAEAIILDIDLHGESITGIDLASHFKLPTLFISGKTRDYLSGIEAVNLQNEFPVEFVMKPANGDRLSKAVEKFVKRVLIEQDKKFVFLDFKGSRANKVDVGDIVYLCAEKERGSASNNKVIYFKSRKPETLVNFNLKDINKYGLSSECFIKTHGSYRVNLRAIHSYDSMTHQVKVRVINHEGIHTTQSLPVSENYRSTIRKKLKPDLLL
jgi:DNA-binding LytR/AlgR family response regulator